MDLMISFISIKGHFVLYPMFSSVQLLSCVWLCVTPWNAACQPSLSITNYQNFLRLMSIKLVRPSNHLMLCPPYSSHLQSFPALTSFQMSQYFTSSGQSIGVSASSSIFPINVHDWFPLGWTNWIPLQSKGLSRVFSTTQFKGIISSALNFFIVQLSHPYMTSEKTIALTRLDLCWQHKVSTF